MSYYGCRGRNIGRVSHFIHQYCGLDAAEQCYFHHSDSIQVRDKVIAKVEWSKLFGEWDVPVFDFHRDFSHCHYKQIRCREEAIEDAILIPKDRTNIEKISDRFMAAAHKEHYQAAKLFASCMEANIDFFVAASSNGNGYKEDFLFCEVTFKNRVEIFQLWTDFKRAQDWILVERSKR